MEARGIDAAAGKLSSTVEGDIEKEDKTLVVRRIRVHYKLEGAADQQDVVERVHNMHKEYCPVYRTVYRSIDISTTYELV